MLSRASRFAGSVASRWTAIASIALHAIRLAGTHVGDRVAVVGCGLVGQIAVRLLHASGAEVIAPNGKPFTEQSIGMTLAVRNLMTDLRSSGEVTGGPKSYSPRDRSAFLSALDQAIRRIQRQRAQQPAPNQD